jgi:hypothetical protein
LREREHEADGVGSLSGLRGAAQEQASSLEAAIKEAEETCDGGPAGECAAAWDNVRTLGVF